MAGYFRPVSATVRVYDTDSAAPGGQVVPVPFPVAHQGVSGTVWTSAASNIRTPSLTVTCPSSNAGSIYISTAATTYAATQRERIMIKLTQGQSFTFTGLPLAGSGYRDLCFGTGLTYIHSSATTQRAVVTYYKQYKGS